MPALSANILRLICNADRPDRVIDQRTLQAPALLRAFDYKVQLGVFIDGALLDSIANWESVTLEVRALTAGVVDHESEVLLTKTVATGFAVPSSAAWLAKTAQHAELDLSLDDTSLAAGDYWLALYVTTTDSPAKEFFLAYGDVKVINSGAGNNGTPQDNAENHYTKAESDARYMATLAADGAAHKHGSAAIGAGVTSKAVAFATAFASAPAFVNAQVAMPDANGANIFATVRADSITAAGFTVELSGPTPDALHTLLWEAYL